MKTLKTGVFSATNQLHHKVDTHKKVRRVITPFVYRNLQFLVYIYRHIYIYIYVYVYVFETQEPKPGLTRLIVEVSRSHTHTHTSGRTPLEQQLARRRGRYASNTRQSQGTNIYAISGIRTHDPSS